MAAANGAFGFLGEVVGRLVAPAFAMTSRARHARTFHPRGEVFHARVVRAAGVPPRYVELADRLVGRALVRFSGALWKHAERLDVLGCALRFRRDSEEAAEPADDDQDLLFATILRPWTMPFAPFTTAAGDYLANDYYAVSPFDAGARDRVFFRLHPSSVREGGAGDRSARLKGAVARGGVCLELGIARGPFGPWEPLCDLLLERVAEVDGEALQFRPFRTGRGVSPRGFVHALRLAVYEASQHARPSHTDDVT